MKLIEKREGPQNLRSKTKGWKVVHSSKLINCETANISEIDNRLLFGHIEYIKYGSYLNSFAISA